MTSIDLNDAIFPVLFHADHKNVKISILIICFNTFVCYIDIDLQWGYLSNIWSLSSSCRWFISLIRYIWILPMLLIPSIMLCYFFEWGFVIHPDKSVLTPSQEIIVRGFVLSSKNMTLILTDQNKLKIKTLFISCLKNNHIFKLCLGIKNKV